MATIQATTQTIGFILSPTEARALLRRIDNVNDGNLAEIRDALDAFVNGDDDA